MSWPKKQGRKRGGKNPDGVTKSIIILLIADGEISSTDTIWEYLQEHPTLRMKTKRQLYDHLRQLEKEYHFIEREPGHRREADKFHLIRDFENFQSVYNFLVNYDYKKEFMATKYFQNYIDPDTFPTEYTLYNLKGLLLDIHTKLTTTEDGHPLTNDELSEEAKEKLFAIFSIPPGEKADFLKRYQDTITTFQSKTVKELTIYVIDTITALNTGAHQAEPTRFLKYLSSYQIRADETPEFIAMIKTYPSVLNLLVNKKYFDLVLFSSFSKMLLHATLDLSKFTEFMKTVSTDEPYIDIIHVLNRFKGLSTSDHSHLYQVLCAVSVNDLFEKNIIDYPFSPENLLPKKRVKTP